MIVAFCGHSKIENAEVADWLLSTCEQLIEEGADTFYLPSYENLLALADFFDVSLDYLCGRSDIPERR